LNPELRGATTSGGRLIVRVVLATSAAALVAAGHLGYLVYMVLGGFLALRRLAWLWPHVVSTVWSVYVTLTGARCPLTTLEKWLLARGGNTPYEDSFIAHYLHGTLYPAQFETAVWLTAMGLVLVSYVIVLSRRRRLAVP
jgi:hypothetical protein